MKLAFSQSQSRKAFLPAKGARSNQEVYRRRCLSVSSSLRSRNPYPFPNSPDPNPYQIFHLMPDASPEQVKQRYYELVKLYHPDSAESRRHESDAAVRHAHFSAITRAYTRLQKHVAGDGAYADEGVANPWRRTASLYGKRYEEPQFVDDRWKDRLLWGILGLSMFSVAAQSIMVRRQRLQNLSDHIHVTEVVPTEWKSSKSVNDEESLRLSRAKQ